MTLALDHIRGHDVMRAGILGCAPDTPLGEVAAIIAKHRVHERRN